MLACVVFEYIRYIVMEGREAFRLIIALLWADGNEAGETFGYYFYNVLLLCVITLFGSVAGNFLSKIIAVKYR